MIPAKNEPLTKEENQVLRNFGFSVERIGSRNYVRAKDLAKLLQNSIPVFSKKDEKHGLFLNWQRDFTEVDLEVMGFVIGPYKLPENPGKS